MRRLRRQRQDCLRFLHQQPHPKHRQNLDSILQALARRLMMRLQE
jgi:hypothetical protein